jgi:enoyl-CoA hydratase/carnithine racemase
MAVTLETGTTKIKAEIDGAIGWLIFNNPERRNAVSLEMWRAIPDVIASFEADDNIRCVVLKGAGDKAFIAGADISQFEKARSDPESVAEYDRTAGAAQNAIRKCAKPTIAMIRGFCIGGGLGTALCCDMRYAAKGSRFAIPAARLGLGYGAAGVKALMDLVGPSATKEIFATAQHYSAEEALRMGLINRMTAENDLESLTRDQCGLIAANAPMTIHAVRRTVDELLRDDGDMGLCDRLVADCFASEDYSEGRRAFMEKRRPIFRGR